MNKTIKYILFAAVAVLIIKKIKASKYTKPMLDNGSGGIRPAVDEVIEIGKIPYCY